MFSRPVICKAYDSWSPAAFPCSALRSTTRKRAAPRTRIPPRISRRTESHRFALNDARLKRMCCGGGDDAKVG